MNKLHSMKLNGQNIHLLKMNMHVPLYYCEKRGEIFRKQIGVLIFSATNYLIYSTKKIKALQEVLNIFCEDRKHTEEDVEIVKNILVKEGWLTKMR